MNVPFLDLSGLHARIRPEIDAALAGVIDASAFIGGKPVAAFERDLATFMGSAHAKGVASCTAALAIALRALELGPRDEVITTAHTAMPTAEAVGLAGARVVLADVDRHTYQLDPAAVEAAITPATRAVVLVHLYGMAAPVDAFLELCARHDLVLIEDIAQAQGARWHGRRLGTFGRAGCLSFFPSKNLGGFGDGGAVVTDDQQVHRFVSMYSNHGREEKYTHEIEGSNERLDALQAAVLAVKLRHLDDWNARRRQVADWYAEELSGVDELHLPAPLADSEPVWHLYVVRAAERDRLRAALKADGIGTGLHYPLALHRQPAFAHLGLGEGSLPGAETVCRECLSLPMDPFLTREQVAFVAERLKAHLAGRLTPSG